MKQIILDWDEGMIPVIETKEEYLEHNKALRGFGNGIFGLGTDHPEEEWAEQARTISEEDYTQLLVLRAEYRETLRAIKSILAPVA